MTRSEAAFQVATSSKPGTGAAHGCNFRHHVLEWRTHNQGLIRPLSNQIYLQVRPLRVQRSCGPDEFAQALFLTSMRLDVNDRLRGRVNTQPLPSLQAGSPSREKPKGRSH